MKKLTVLCFLCVVFFESPAAMAAWDDNNISEIIDDVKAIRKDVIGDGNVKVVAEDLRQQLKELVDKGFILRDSVEDILTWLQSRERPYYDFAGDYPRCQPFTPCGQFREDLKRFFLEVADQRYNFPAIEKVGLGDGSHAVAIIENSPPILLFGLYEVFSRVPDWTEMPEKLQSIFDEIGDPDVFSVRLEDDQQVVASSMSMTSNMVVSRTPTQRFCDRWEKRIDKELDPVRLNRIEFFIYSLRQGLGLFESLTSETIGATVVGEGTETVIPNPLKAQAKIVLVAFDIIQRGAQTFRDNLGVCRANRRELELQVAQCTQLVDFILPSRRDDVYLLVQTKVENAADEFVPVSLAEKSLAEAERLRKEGKWKRAYHKLCAAYRQIGR